MYVATVKRDNSSRSFRLSMSRRFYFFAFIVFIPLCVLIVSVVFISANQKEGVSLGEHTEMVEAIRREYFIAQTNFKSLENNINLSDLKKRKIACIKGDVFKIKGILDIESVQIIESEDIFKWVKDNGFDGVVVVPVERADFRLKTLAINDIFFWERGTSVSEYSLLYQETVRIGKQETQGFEENNFSNKDLFTYVAGGEVIPARAVARKFRRTGDYTFPFHKVKDLFNEADVSSIILENSILGSPTPCRGCTWFVGDEAFIEGLEYLGVDIISPGNHIGDGGVNAIGRTIEVLDEANILHTGFSTLNLDDASKPAIYEVDGFKFAFLGYDDVAWFHWAGAGWGGVATVSQRFDNGTKQLLMDKINSDVSIAKKQADYVVILMSWGDREYVNWALGYQMEMAHALIDAGADMIVGSHQHWVSEIEFYKEKPIFYSLGNFVFDQTHTDPTRQGVLVKFYFFQKKLVSVKIIPHLACGPQQSAIDDENCNHFQPQILEERDPVYREILERMFEYSEI